MLLSTLQWGTVGEWVSSLATLTAVVVALVFSLRTEREQRDAALAAVHAWFEVHESDTGAPRSGVLWLVNNTNYPLYEWGVVVSWSVDGKKVEVATGQGDHGLLPPGKHDFPLETEGVQLPGNDAEVAVDLRFRDASERGRHRLPTGRLVRA